jgi:RNAse (barnase) inhibitor barstar
LVVRIPANKITDWETFHDVFQNALGFPDFYGRNMNAWIDCMTSMDAASDGLSTVNVLPGEILVLRIDDPFDFQRRCPEQYVALIECSAFVNCWRTELGESPVLALLLNGR